LSPVRRPGATCFVPHMQKARILAGFGRILLLLMMQTLPLPAVHAKQQQPLLLLLPVCLVSSGAAIPMGAPTQNLAKTQLSV